MAFEPKPQSGSDVGPAVSPEIGDLPAIEIDERTFLHSHFALPPLPEVSTRIMEEIASGDTGPREIAELLSADVALTALTFKVVNSAYYALPRRIDKINQAVAYLGLSEINRLILTLSVMNSLQPQDAVAFRRFWSHSFYSALISRYLSRVFFRSLDLEGLHSAVLLHDVGKLVYMKFFPLHYRRLVRYERRNRCFVTKAEQEFQWPSHQRFGVLLCERWQLPETVRSACSVHEIGQLANLDEDDPKAEFHQVTVASNLMAHLADGVLTDELKELSKDEIRRALNCSDEDFLVSMGEVYELRSAVDDFLSQLQ